MKQFFKENYALVAGIALPLLLSLVFFVATKISTMGIDPPKFSVVYASGMHDPNSEYPWGFKVKEGTLYFSYNTPKEPAHWRTPQLYLYDPLNHVSKAIVLPDVAGATGLVTGTVEELKGMKLSTEPKSPDGYSFIRSDEYGNHGVMMDMFGGGRYRSGYVLQKENYKEPIPGYIGNVKFIGWVTP